MIRMTHKGRLEVLVLCTYAIKVEVSGRDARNHMGSIERRRAVTQKQEADAGKRQGRPELIM